MNKEFRIEDGQLIKYTGTSTSVYIPEGVTRIGYGAFQEIKNLTEVVMPDSVTSIGGCAFYNCRKLKSIKFSDSLIEIESEAFRSCKALKKIELPNTLHTVGGGAFAGCTKLSEISCDSKVYRDGGNPFYNIFEDGKCELLYDENGFLVFNHILYEYIKNDETIIIPEGVIHIAPGVFQSGTLSWQKKLNVKKIICPDTLKSIGSEAFSNCIYLEAIEMPDDVEIKDGAFNGCLKLADENGMIIHRNKLYEYIGKDTIVEIPSGVEEVAGSVFDADRYDCNPDNNKITKVIMPEGLKKIGRYAFNDCLSLQEVSLPDSVETIDASAFYGCRNLKSIDVPETAAVFDFAFTNCEKLADENGFVIVNDMLFQCISEDAEVIVPEHVKVIGNEAFRGLNIKKVILPKGLQKLGCSFNDCEELEEIKIPEGITKIEIGTFRNCYSLEKVEFPETLEQIGRGAFEGCRSLKEICFPSGIKAVPTRICSGCTELESVCFEGDVEKIGASAFSGCAALKQVSLPESVRKIEDYAFRECASLEDIIIPNNECEAELTSFDNCPKLFDENGMKIVSGVLLEYAGNGGKVTIPDGVECIGPDVFREGFGIKYGRMKNFHPEGNLKEIIIPDSVKVIFESAFENCKNLSKVTLSKNVESMGSGVFADCIELEEVKLPSTLVALGEVAFKGCEKLKNIFVEEGNRNYSDVDGILYNADKSTLLYCPPGKKLKEFVIADSVSSIEGYAFYDCKDIKKLYIPQSVKTVGSKAFARSLVDSGDGIISDIKIAIGAGSQLVGHEAIYFPYGEEPIVAPMIPPNFPKENELKIRLGMGYCVAPEKYDEEYSAEYQKYVKSHQKTLLKKASSINQQAVLDYFSVSDESNPVSGKVEKINYKKLSEVAKVELLERAVMQKDVAGLQKVIEGCKEFEFTSRALGLACLYGNVEIVKTLIENGATFKFEYTSKIKRKYGAGYGNNYSAYQAEYSPMIAVTEVDPYIATLCVNAKELHFGDLPATTEEPADEETRAEIAEYLLSVDCDFDKETALFYAILWGCLPVAKKMLEKGVIISDYYLSALCDSANSPTRNEALASLTTLSPEVCAECLGMLISCAENKGRQVVLNQKSFEENNSPLFDAKLLKLVVDKTDVGKLKRTKILEMAVEKNDVAATAILVEQGWIKNTSQREKLIKLASDNKNIETLTWLMDYKNKTADLATEAAKEEKKMLRELNENPNSVAALKKIWRYKKLEDGTLMITGYKGYDTKVEVPAKIGKSEVTVIGKEAFYCGYYSNAENVEARKKITSVVLPEGIVEIGLAAFMECEALEHINLPSTLKTIDARAFNRCRALEPVEIPENIETIGEGAFWGCEKMYEGDFLVVNGMFSHYIGADEIVEVPEGVTVIDSQVFSLVNVKKVIIPNTVECIRVEAFWAMKNLEEVEIPSSVKRIEKRAFCDCKNLKELQLNDGVEYIGENAFLGTALKKVRIPKSVTEIGNNAFGATNLQDIYISSGVKTFGIDCFGWAGYDKILHTTEGSDAEKYFKEIYPSAPIFYDYDDLKSQR